MAQRGRPRKIKEEAIIPVVVDHAKLLKQFEQEQRVQLETLYKDLANIRYHLDLALTHVGLMDDCESLSHAAFRAGRAYGPLDEANDKLQEILDEMYDNNDFDHWDDVVND